MFRTIELAAAFIMCIILIGYGEEPSFPHADPEIHGIPTDALEELSATINKHLKDDHIVGAEFLIMKRGHIVMHETYGWIAKSSKRWNPTRYSTSGQ